MKKKVSNLTAEAAKDSNFSGATPSIDLAELKEFQEDFVDEVDADDDDDEGAAKSLIQKSSKSHKKETDPIKLI